MKVTINLDPEALAMARLLSRQKNISLGDFVSEMILRNIRQSTPQALRNGIPVFQAENGRPPDIQLVNALRD